MEIILSISSKAMEILIVENEFVIAANLQETLEGLGYGISGVAISGTEAIEKAVAMRPSLILMDIRLQGAMDGVEAAERIWNQLQIPVVYVTGHADKITLERAKLTFPFGYILKPVKERELYAAIEVALSRCEREQFLTTVLQRIGDGVIVVDRQGRVKYLNLVAEWLTGWQQYEARDQDLMTVFNLADEETRQPIDNPARAILQQDDIIDLNHRVLLIHKDGSSLPITDSIASLIDNQGNLTGAVLVFRDDTPRQLQEEHKLALQRTQLMACQVEELQRLNQLKDDFLSTISHELCTPLAVIKMAIQMLEITLDQRMPSPLESAGQVPSQSVAQYIAILHEQCNDELALVNDLLALQNLGEESSTNRDHIEVLELIPHIAETLHTYAQQRQQQLQLLLPSALPPLISDFSMFTRIFKELLTNACKYTPLGGLITVSAQHIEERLQVIVTNSGVEIPEAELPRVFEKFYRIPTSDRHHQGGTGLGLALIRKMTTHLGGSIWAESGAGHTRFIVELPLSLGV